jgi:hypothetical protein
MGSAAIMTVGDSAKAKLLWEYPDGSKLELDLTTVTVKNNAKGEGLKGEFTSKHKPKAIV